MEDAQQALRKANDPSAKVAPEERAQWLADGAMLAREWRCPNAGHVPVDDVRHLSVIAQETIADVERLTKTSGCKTCPNAYLRIPWVLRIWRIRQYREKQMLPMVRPRITAIELACIDAIDAGHAAREEYEWKQSMKPQKT